MMLSQGSDPYKIDEIDEEVEEEKVREEVDSSYAEDERIENPINIS